MDEELHRRVRWLESRIVEIYWVGVSLTGLLVGFGVAQSTGTTGITRLAITVGVWMVAAFVASKMAFRGFPDHIDPL